MELSESTKKEDGMDFHVEDGDTETSPRKGGCLRNIFCFAAMYSLVALIFETLKAYTISQVTTLEKQFGLSSVRSGFLVSSNEFGYIVAILFFGHCGRGRHIPKTLAGALFFYGISGICTGLLNFAYPVTLPQDAVGLNLSTSSAQVGLLCQNVSDSSNDICSSVSEDSDYIQSTPQMIFVLLMITTVIRGATKSPVYTLGFPFLDNNTKDRPQSSLLTGIVTTISFLAFAIAVYMGGVFSAIPVDLSDTNINPFHPSWIGAWWMGYLVFGGIAVALAVPVFIFPKHIKEQSVNHKVDKTVSFKEELKDMHKSILRIFSNPAVTLIILGVCCKAFVIGGSYPFKPKYIESQFRVPSFLVNIIFGTQSLVWTTIGTLFGGIITSRLKLSSKGCILMVAIVLSVATAINSICLGLGCENQYIKGISESRLDINSSTLCQCEEEYFPVCGSDKVTYSSPCLAGCRLQNGSAYSDCSEIPGGEAIAGWCERDCPYFIPYVAVEVLAGTAVSLSIIPSVMALMRVVEPRDKSMALALPSFVNSVLGFLSGPIVYGSLVDSTCSFWQTTCGTAGACALYDLPQLRYRFKGLDLGVLLLSSGSYFAAFFLFKFGIVSYDDKSDE